MTADDSTAVESGPFEFTPLHTVRLIVRAARSDDVDNLYARRNDPEVAELQDWEYPYPMEKAVSLISSAVEMGRPRNEEWWPAMVCLQSGEVVGDLVVHLTWEGRTAEVGYSLDRRHWGNGYATEALTALVDFLFDGLGVTRVFGMLDPANPRSARVLERTGFLYEGRTRSSYWKEGEVSDDLIYGMTKADRDTWAGRPTRPPSRLRFVEVTSDNLDDVAQLHTHESQTAYVAPMSRSFGHALFPDVVDGAAVTPWLRAVEADGLLVAFVMLALASEHHPEPYLWRLLVDRLHQRRGIGRRIIEMVVADCRERGDTGLLTSWGEGVGSPREFYLGLGFEPTGRTIDDETEARLPLA